MKNTILFDQRVKWIAHRGLPSQTVENTVEGFKLAAKMDFFGIETDVHQTLDNKLIVHHDDNVLSLTGKDLLIDKTNYDILKVLELKNTKHNIPLFSEYLSICRQYNKVAIIELKAPFTHLKVQSIVDEVIENKMLENSIFISFYVDNLFILRSILKESHLQLLTGKVENIHIEISKTFNLDISSHYNGITKDQIDLIHSNGQKVSCWTVNNEETAMKMIELGVDYITTDGF